MNHLVGNRFINASIDKDNFEVTSATKTDDETYDPAIPQCKDISPYELFGEGWIPKNIVYTYPMLYPYLCIYMFYVMVISVTGNMTMILAFMKTKSLQNPLNYVIINLAVADLASGLIGGFLSALANGARYFFLGKTMCLVEDYLLAICGCAGLNSVALMAFERYIVICKPTMKPHVNKNNAIVGLIFTWVYSCLWNTPPLVLWDGYDVEGIGTSCAPNWYVTDATERGFMIAYFCCGFMIPFAIIIFCYGKLIWTLRQVAKESSVSGSKNPEKEVTKMIVVMVTAFCFAWIPYAACAMYNVFNAENQLHPSISAIPVFFAKAAVCYNPLIYIGLNRQFREAVSRMIFGFNPWSEEVAISSVSSQGSMVSTISSKKSG